MARKKKEPAGQSPSAETEATETQANVASPENAEGEGRRVFASISKASFLWSKFDPGIQGVPPITRAGVEFDASHRNSVEREAEKAGVKLTIEER